MPSLFIMASRLFIKRTVSYTNTYLKNQIYNSRSYASEMAFTFASPSEVSKLFYNKFFQLSKNATSLHIIEFFYTIIGIFY